MYNLRYHIASLVAVFLALSLGLLLGGITVQSGVLTKQRAALVQSLRTDYTKLKTQNQTLNQDLDLEKRLARAMVDDAVADRLKGGTMLVLTNAGQVEGLSATEAAIRDAGGKPPIVALVQAEAGSRRVRGRERGRDGAGDDNRRRSTRRRRAARWPRSGRPERQGP